MAEELEHAEIAYTHTYDQFTVFFYDNHVFIGKKEHPIGQCCVDVMNLDETILNEIDQRVSAFVLAAKNLLTEKTDSAAVLTQERLNAVWELIFSLPVYQDLKMDEECNYHTFKRLMADREKWAQVQDPTSAGCAKYQGMMTGLACFADSLRKFRQRISLMAEKYVEPLERRNCNTYAEAYACFFADMISLDAWLFDEDFEQSFPMEVSFVPMMHPTEEGKIFIAEKAAFNSLTDFLRTEFYRGLAIGNAPRRCHNCGRYFLLTSGYNICYCNNIAPVRPNAPAEKRRRARQTVLRRRFNSRKSYSLCWDTKRPKWKKRVRKVNPQSRH